MFRMAKYTIFISISIRKSPKRCVFADLPPNEVITVHIFARRVTECCDVEVCHLAAMYYSTSHLGPFHSQNWVAVHMKRGQSCFEKDPAQNIRWHTATFLVKRETFVVENKRVESTTADVRFSLQIHSDLQAFSLCTPSLHTQARLIKGGRARAKFPEQIICLE